MGILNVTPDSFYDGGRFVDYNRAIDEAHKMVTAGASILDIGGESTRPGATPISVAQECDRVLPVLEILSKDFKDSSIVLSIDTRHPEVMSYALEHGVSFINDINALQCQMTLEFDALLNTIKNKKASVCLMHMQGNPQTMQFAPAYTNVVEEVRQFLESRLQFCLDKGLEQDSIVLDPGFGFGKTPEHNASLLKNINIFKGLGCRILVGLSRKSFIGKWLTEAANPADRLEGSLAASVIAVLGGADIIRTHDVEATVKAVKIADMFK